ncbi:MAG: hypothetical protein LBM12_00735 [Candidatus Nomurabacteria bacterium]|jgi:hypothetical protein|nr:hypothetical protein [Candidatus Nomurabacteria bacterium]
MIEAAKAQAARSGVSSARKRRDAQFAFMWALICLIASGVLWLFYIMVAVMADGAEGAIESVLLAFLVCVSLAWRIPMMFMMDKIRKGERKNTIAFGVCTLIFLDFISGIVLLCASEEPNEG